MLTTRWTVYSNASSPTATDGASNGFQRLVGFYRGRWKPMGLAICGRWKPLEVFLYYNPRARLQLILLLPKTFPAYPLFSTTSLPAATATKHHSNHLQRRLQAAPTNLHPKALQIGKFSKPNF